VKDVIIAVQRSSLLGLRAVDMQVVRNSSLNCKGLAMRTAE
jgi:hypothetical protein